MGKDKRDNESNAKNYHQDPNTPPPVELLDSSNVLDYKIERLVRRLLRNLNIQISAAKSVEPKNA